MRASLLGAAVAAAIGASTILLGATHAEAGEMKEVSCSAIEMKYTGGGDIACYSYDDQGNQTEAVTQRIVVKTHSSEFVVSYTASKFKTYLLMRPLRSLVEGQYFADTDNWQLSTKYAGFEIAAFNGYESSGSTPVLCAAFARFSGNPGNYEFDSGVGYKNLADGIYCALSGQAALINPIDNLYRVVEDALGKVAFPPE
jgi:hypothetical protein